LPEYDLSPVVGSDSGQRRQLAPIRESGLWSGVVWGHEVFQEPPHPKFTLLSLKRVRSIRVNFFVMIPQAAEGHVPPAGYPGYVGWKARAVIFGLVATDAQEVHDGFR
jgi:hypothetical protein